MILLTLVQGLVRLRRLMAEHGHFARRVMHLLGRSGEIFQPIAQGLQVPRLSADLLRQVAHNLGAYWLRVVSPLAAAVGRCAGGMEVVVGVVVMEVVRYLGVKLLLGEGPLIKREIFSLVFHIGGKGGPI